MEIKTKVIADPLYGAIPFTQLESEIFSTEIFNRLHYILQDSMAYLVFPSNRTSRFSHSVGVMHLASEVFFNSIINAHESVLNEFMKLASKDVRRISREVINLARRIPSNKARVSCAQVLDNSANKVLIYLTNFLQSDKTITRYTPSFISENREWRITYPILLQSVRLAGLLHDVGHLPFSHIFEFTLERLYSEYSEQFPEYRRILNSYINSDKKIHEELTKDVIRFLFEYELPNKSNKDSCVSKLAYILFEKVVLAILIEAMRYPSLRAIHSIISSDIDADRLDFIGRDGISSGILTGTGEINRLVKLYALIKENKEFLFVPSIQSLNEVEQILWDRFIIYKYLINHHKVARYDYLLEKVILELLKSARTCKSKKCKSKESDRLQLIIDLIHERIIRVLNRQRTRRDLDALAVRMSEFSTLDDIWLLKMLRDFYLYLSIENDNHDKSKTKYKELHFMLQELLTSSKSLRSLWKRDLDFWIFVKDYILTDDSKSITSLINFKNYLMHYQSTYCTENSQLQKCESIKNLFKLTTEVLSNRNIEKFIMLLDNLVEKYGDGWKIEFSIRFENILNSLASEEYNNPPIILCAATFHKLKPGIHDLKLVDLSTGEIVNISELSPILYNITNKRYRSKPFEIYYETNKLSNRDVSILVSKAFEEYIHNLLDRVLNELNLLFGGDTIGKEIGYSPQGQKKKT